MRAFTFDVRTVNQPFAFVSDQTIGLINGDTATASPAFSGFAGFAFGIECLRHSRAAFFDFAVSLGFMQTRDFQRQTARCGKPFYVAVRQIRRIQLRSQVSGKRFSKAAQSLRWQFFRASTSREA
ncbi:hypothetical protein SRABI106_04530 [Rahnella aquatilis]|nr:hypothetical protein SRABI106_04530 [Rahnella aquatilis]